MHNVDLPSHRYVWVWNEMIYKNSEEGLTPAVWFGISSTPGRAFGCNVLLENGATVIDLPLSALAHVPDPETTGPREIWDVMMWDSFGWDVETYEPQYLSGLSVHILGDDYQLRSGGEAWFAIDWKDNGWSDYPEQHKWLWVVAEDEGGLCAMPQNRLLFYESSFTEGKFGKLPDGGIQRQTKVYKAEL